MYAYVYVDVYVCVYVYDMYSYHRRCCICHTCPVGLTCLTCTCTRSSCCYTGLRGG